MCQIVIFFVSHMYDGFKFNIEGIRRSGCPLPDNDTNNPYISFFFSVSYRIIKKKKQPSMLLQQMSGRGHPDLHFFCSVLVDSIFVVMLCMFSFEMVGMG
jgi:hypothetical protein